jgi:hypothetical protein
VFLRTLFGTFVVCAFPPAFLSGQAGTPAKSPDFPVILQQNVTAGKTPVGSKIQAKLTIATLLNGTVIPRNATLSGEVTESAAKTAGDPSRLAIRMDSVEWKSGTSAIKLYFTGWYYPTVDQPGQDLQYGPQQPANRTWNGQGQYPDSNSHVYRPFPGSDSGNDSPVPDTPSSTTGTHSVAMKDVEAKRTGDGTIVLTSKRSNVKLARYTTYVVSAGDTVPQK